MANAHTFKTELAVAQALILENQLCFAMYSASLAMTKLYKKHLRELGLTYPQYLVMLALWERDEVTVSELGTQLFLDSGTLTPLLKRMELLGLLCRSRDVVDERRVLIRLSEQGRALRRRAAALPEQLLCALPAPEQLAGLRETLKDLRTKLLEQADDGG